MWDALTGNARPAHWAPRHTATADVITTVTFLARAARSPRTDLPGLRLVLDDTPEWVTRATRIDRPPTPAGLWLEITVGERW
ncbi:MAG: hypothetical protein ACRD0V_21425 [Acidimicrobiales bacterium]